MLMSGRGLMRLDTPAPGPGPATCCLRLRPRRSLTSGFQHLSLSPRHGGWSLVTIRDICAVTDYDQVIRYYVYTHHPPSVFTDRHVCSMSLFEKEKFLIHQYAKLSEDIAPFQVFVLLLNSSGIQWTSLTFSDSVAEIIQDDSWKVCSSNGDFSEFY